jgi:undecaprenyl-diphosphatase
MKPKRSTLRLLLLSGFLILSYQAYHYAYLALDLSISRALQSLHQPLFSLVMNLVSEIGDDFYPWLVGGLVVVTLIYYQAKTEAIKVAGLTLLSALTGSIVKLLVHRPRPDTDLVQIQELVTGQSFPSLHVLVFTVFFGYLLFLSASQIKKTWLRLVLVSLFSFLILSIGLSRIYLGAHWASDVLGGYLLGAFFISYII